MIIIIIIIIITITTSLAIAYTSQHKIIPHSLAACNADGAVVVWDVAATQLAWRNMITDHPSRTTTSPRTLPPATAVCWAGPGPKRVLVSLHTGGIACVWDPWAGVSGAPLWRGGVGAGGGDGAQAMVVDPMQPNVLLAWGGGGNMTMLTLQVGGQHKIDQ